MNREDAWRGRRRHAQRGRDSLLGVYRKCPSWRGRWAEVRSELNASGATTYRGWRLALTSEGILLDHARYPGGVMPPWDDKSDGGPLFERCHQDLIDALAALAPALRADRPLFDRLVRELALHWPSDPAWTAALHHRVATIEALAYRRNPGDGQGLHPKLLAPRRESLQLHRVDRGRWQSAGGVAGEVIMAQGHPDRQAALATLMHLPGLVAIELPPRLDYSVVRLLARDLERVSQSSSPVVKHALQQGRTWRLAIRRIQGLGFNGCFDAPSQTLIVDPRHLISVRHEFCHWVLNHGVKKESETSHEDPEAQVHRLEEELFGV